jgi:hypothetical protein
MNNSSLPAWRKFLANHKLNKLYDEDIAKLSCKELHEAFESFAYIIYGKNVTDPLFNRHTQIIIEKLYHKSIEENYYWQFCSFKTYKNHLNKLPFEYFKKHKEDGRNLYSFYPYELNELKNYYDSEKKMFVYRFRKDGTALHLYFNATETDTFTFITNSLHEKIDLIEKRIETIKNYRPPIEENSETTKTQPENKPVTEIYCKASEIIAKLNEYQFSIYLLEQKYSINKVKEALKENTISTPYIIALLSKLGFITYLLDNYFKSKTELHKELSKILNCAGRRIKGNINVLSKHSKDDKDNYTSWQFIDDIDLQSLGL